MENSSIDRSSTSSTPLKSLDEALIEDLESFIADLKMKEARFLQSTSIHSKKYLGISNDGSHKTETTLRLRNDPTLLLAIRVKRVLRPLKISYSTMKTPPLIITQRSLKNPLDGTSIASHNVQSYFKPADTLNMTGGGAPYINKGVAEPTKESAVIRPFNPSVDEPNTILANRFYDHKHEELFKAPILSFSWADDKVVTSGKL